MQNKCQEKHKERNMHGNSWWIILAIQITCGMASFSTRGGLSVTKGRSKLSWSQHPKWKEGLSLLERSGCCATGEKHHEHLFNRNFSFVWREGHWRNCWKTPWRTCSFHFQPFIEGIASRIIFNLWCLYFCNVSNQPWTFEGHWDPKKISCLPG